MSQFLLPDLMQVYLIPWLSAEVQVSSIAPCSDDPTVLISEWWKCWVGLPKMFLWSLWETKLFLQGFKLLKAAFLQFVSDFPIGFCWIKKKKSLPVWVLLLGGGFFFLLRKIGL